MASKPSSEAAEQSPARCDSDEVAEGPARCDSDEAAEGPARCDSDEAAEGPARCDSDEAAEGPARCDSDEAAEDPARCDSEEAADISARCDSHEVAVPGHARCDSDEAADISARCDSHEVAVPGHPRCDSEEAADISARCDSDEAADIAPRRCDSEEAAGLQQKTTARHAPAYPQKIQDLGAVRQYIEQIDFTMLKSKLTAPVSEEGFGWTVDQADRAEERYKKWLFLRRKYDGEILPPTHEIDAFWHAHILDTMAYHRDTAAILGRYLHHYPYFGMRGDDDSRALVNAFNNTKQRFSEEYGEEIVKAAARKHSVT
jgi:hypothetical protein